MNDARVKFFECLAQRCLRLTDNPGTDNEIDRGLLNLYEHRWENKPILQVDDVHEHLWDHNDYQIGYKCALCHKYKELEQVTIELPTEILCSIFEYAKIPCLLISKELRTAVIPRIIDKKLNWFRTGTPLFRFNQNIPNIRYTLVRFDHQGKTCTVIYDLTLKKQRLFAIKLSTGYVIRESIQSELIIDGQTVHTPLYNSVRRIILREIEKFPQDWPITIKEDIINGIIKDNFEYVLREWDIVRKGMYLIATALELQLEIPEITYYKFATPVTVIEKQFRDISAVLEPQIRARLDY